MTSLERKREMIEQMREKVRTKEKKNEELGDQVRKMRKRELEIVKRWDMDDIDLVTERLKIIRSSASSEFSKSKF